MVTGFNFNYRFKVHFDECDMCGIVHNSNYIKFFERGRTAYISNLGFEYSLDDMGEDYYIVVRSNYCEYLKAATFNQYLRVYVKSSEMKRSSWKVEYLITDDNSEVVHAKGYTVLVKTDETFSKPKQITSWLRSVIDKFENSSC